MELELHPQCRQKAGKISCDIAQKLDRTKAEAETTGQRQKNEKKKPKKAIGGSSSKIIPFLEGGPIMIMNERVGYRIVGVKNGWMVMTDRGLFVCPFIASKDEKSPLEALKEALRFVDGHPFSKTENIGDKDC